jgi:transposase InsO family protein
MLVRALHSLANRALRSRKFSCTHIYAPHYGKNQAKPDWVRQEVIRLKALLPHAGCRQIACVFNRLHAAKRKMTVSKSYVSYTVQRHRYEITVLRRRLKHRIPRHAPKNRIWAIDLTGKGDVTGEIHSILGIIDHGSRKLLALRAVNNKNAWTLLGHLFLAIGRFGKPRIIRSDNESVFKARVFRMALALAGIRQQFTTPGCPWMNGRIERAFGTLKGKLDQLKINGRETLATLLAEFDFWYNATRPHQHLAGLTPDETWRGIDPYAHAPKSVQLFTGWGGMLRGFHFQY